MTTEPTEGWLTQSPLYRESGIPAVSVAECDRRVKAERDRCTELRALLDTISEEATEAHFLPTLNGAIPETADGLRDEARRLADALHRIGHSIHPERWTDPQEPRP